MYVCTLGARAIIVIYPILHQSHALFTCKLVVNESSENHCVYTLYNYNVYTSTGKPVIAYSVYHIHKCNIMYTQNFLSLVYLQKTHTEKPY